MLLLSALTDGQKIAKRLSSQIGLEMKISGILKQYSALMAKNHRQSSIELSIVLDLSSSFWVSSDNDESSEPSIHVKQAVVQNYLLIQRSSEELMLLDQEMHNTLQYFEKRMVCIKAKIEDLNQAEEQTCYSRGAVCLLSKLLTKVMYQLIIAIGQFSEFIQVSSALPPRDESDLDTWSDSNDESDIESDSN